jgi:hypothetical protein
MNHLLDLFLRIRFFAEQGQGNPTLAQKALADIFRSAGEAAIKAYDLPLLVSMDDEVKAIHAEVKIIQESVSGRGIKRTRRADLEERCKRARSLPPVDCLSS